MNGRIRAWRVLRVLAVGAVVLGFLSVPLGLGAFGSFGVATLDRDQLRALAFAALALIPIGMASFMFSQRRLLRAALSEPARAELEPSSTPSVLKGGAQASELRVSYPLARLEVDRRRLSIRMLGKQRFTCERNEVTSIAPQRWFLGSGITIQAHSPARTAIFWALDPVAIVRTLRRANYPL